MFFQNQRLLILLLPLASLLIITPTVAQMSSDQPGDADQPVKKGGCGACHEQSELLGGDEQGGLKRKINFTKMMMLGKSAKRIDASDHPEAKENLYQAREKIALADSKLHEGDEESAAVFLSAAMSLFNGATRLVPSEGTLDKQKQMYLNRVAQLEVARLNHHRNFKRMVSANGAEAGVSYDEEQVDRLTGEAQQLAEKANYQLANERLSRAQNEVQGAIQKMMDNQEIVYKLDIDTPEKEFTYEHNKYPSYEELIPVAIERLKPPKGQQLLAKRLSDKGMTMAEEARATAKLGDYPTAIRMVQDATAQIRKSLKLLGVPDLG